jgi:hypothetical protein
MSTEAKTQAHLQKVQLGSAFCWYGYHALPQYHRWFMYVMQQASG